jgi:protein-disulfide isomerase
MGCSQVCDSNASFQPTPSTTIQCTGHPAARLIAVALAGIGALMVAEWYHFEYASKARAHEELRTAFAKLDREMDQVRNHARTLYSIFQQGEKKEIPVRDDDPVKNLGPDRLMAVVISDFRCPHCSRFAKYMKEVVEPMFGDALAVTFKHFPADTTCNRRIRKTLHSKACLGSAAVEAARMLGGTDAFWKAHDLLFASQEQLQDDRFYAGLAAKLGLDSERFAEAMNSQAVMDRIAEDIELAVTIGLRGTPAVYIEGRYVPSLAREQDVFWKEIRRRHQDRIRSRRGNDTTGPK